MKMRITYLVILAWLAGCAAKPAPIPIVAGEFEGVIFPAKEAHSTEYVYGWGWRPVPSWTPSRGDIKLATTRIRPFLEKKAPQIAKRLGEHEYGCQFFGIDSDGKRMIYCSFFPKAMFDPEWRSSPVIVDDGGSVFFQVFFDMGLGDCVKLSINGDG